MRSKKHRGLVGLVCLMMTSCSNLDAPKPAPPTPPVMALPGQLTNPCSEPKQAESGEMDEITAVLKIVYDQYGDCAGKVIELIRCAQGGSCDGL